MTVEIVFVNVSNEIRGRIEYYLTFDGQNVFDKKTVLIAFGTIVAPCKSSSRESAVKHGVI